MKRLPLKHTDPPKWILGEDADLSECLVHLHHPRFMCRVREDQFTQAEIEHPKEFYAFTFSGGMLTDFYWIDPQPSDSDLDELFEQAADFIELFDDL